MRARSSFRTAGSPIARTVCHGEPQQEQPDVRGDRKSADHDTENGESLFPFPLKKPGDAEHDADQADRKTCDERRAQDKRLGRRLLDPAGSGVLDYARGHDEAQLEHNHKNHDHKRRDTQARVPTCDRSQVLLLANCASIVGGRRLEWIHLSHQNGRRRVSIPEKRS